jgi:hypothetical protein
MNKEQEFEKTIEFISIRFSYDLGSLRMYRNEVTLNLDGHKPFDNITLASFFYHKPK